MHHAKALVAAFLAVSSATATAATDPPNNPTDEQTACAVAAAQDYEKANAAIADALPLKGVCRSRIRSLKGGCPRTFVSDGRLASLPASQRLAYGRMP
jgi:hypothetical protein